MTQWYSWQQWILFFFLYSFLGWIWETCYTSIKAGKLQNRGFLRGPLIPIYGCGAVTVLLATMPMRDYLPAVFLCGMLAASLLEYVTGICMERIFGVRYWDYSNDWGNINGYVCVKASLLWGVFSVMLQGWLHLPLERFVLSIHEGVLQPIVFGCSLLFAADFALSVRAALDLKAVLRSMAAEHEELQRLQARLDAVQAVIAEEIAERKMQLDENLQILNEYVEELAEENREARNAKKEEIRAKKEELEQWRSDRKDMRAADVEQLREQWHEQRAHWDALWQERVAKAGETWEERREKVRTELAEIQMKLNARSSFTESSFGRRQFSRLLNRNNLQSKQYANVLERLRERIKAEQKKK